MVAAVCHDLLEDTNTFLVLLQQTFGHRIARLVEAVSKQRVPVTTSDAGRRHLVFSRVVQRLGNDPQDLPALLIKLAERLDHMTFSADYFPLEQRLDLAAETMDVFAPLAERLGVWELKAHLEDLAFRYLNLEEYRRIAEQLVP